MACIGGGAVSSSDGSESRPPVCLGCCKLDACVLLEAQGIGLCLQQAEGQGLAHSLLFAFYQVSSNNNNVEMEAPKRRRQSQRQTARWTARRAGQAKSPAPSLAGGARSLESTRCITPAALRRGQQYNRAATKGGKRDPSGHFADSWATLSPRTSLLSRRPSPPPHRSPFCLCSKPGNQAPITPASSLQISPNRADGTDAP